MTGCGTAALDLGTSRIKLAVLRPNGSLERMPAVDAPTHRHEGDRVESDPEAWLTIAADLLDGLASEKEAPVLLGLACQRSSFLLWESDSGRPVTPLISWQDRRGVTWCRRHADDVAEIRKRTGLLPTPHYMGPKLAVMLEEDPALRDGLGRGQLMAGTLDTYLIRQWGGQNEFETEPTMAARTLMMDIESGDWDPDLLEKFGVPRKALPWIVPTLGSRIQFRDRFVLQCRLADQTAALLAFGDIGQPSTLVNLGTGGFVLHPARSPAISDPATGYLCAPLPFTECAYPYIHEGTLNGLSEALMPYRDMTPVWPEADPCPHAFCVPDSAGVGAPFWRSDVGPLYTAEAEALEPGDKFRVVLEGVIFRVAAMIEDLDAASETLPVVLSGGVGRIEGLAAGLAGAIGRGVARSKTVDATLYGAARLAALDPASVPLVEREDAQAGDACAYLREKFERWKVWVGQVLG